MADACEHHPSVFDVETIITEFLADTTRSSMQLPCMDAVQRKLTKKLVEKRPNLTCESYGFGQDRQMHLFKMSSALDSASGLADCKAIAGASTVTVKNTFIDDWLAPDNEMERESMLFRSMPPSLSPSIMTSCAAENDNTLGRSSVKEASCKAKHPWDAASVDRSTVATSSRSASGSPKGSSREVLMKPPGLSTPIACLEIRNTFFNFELPPSDERAVQSMPHGMFRQALWVEALSEQVAEEALCSPKAPNACAEPLFGTAPERFPPSVGESLLVSGAEVLISGLQKCPAFNGLSGTVKGFDAEIGRYDVSLAMPEGGHKLAKIKRENILLVTSLHPHPIAPQLVPLMESRISFFAAPCVPPVNLGRERKSSKQALNLTALV